MQQRHGICRKPASVAASFGIHFVVKSAPLACMLYFGMCKWFVAGLELELFRANKVLEVKQSAVTYSMSHYD